jgi:Transposase, Mutator family
MAGSTAVPGCLPTRKKSQVQTLPRPPSFSHQHRAPVRPYQQRLNKEITRRTDVVGVLPNPEALLCLAGAVLVEAHDGQVSDRRYLSKGSMALLTATMRGPPTRWSLLVEAQAVGLTTVRR